MARKGLPKSIIAKYGISKKAWSVYRGMAKKGTRARTTGCRTKRSSRARGLTRGLGRGLSVKNILAGTIGLILMQRYQPFGGQYKPAVDKIALGITLPIAGLDNADMLTVGVKEAVATLVNSYLGGGLGSGGGGGI